MSSSALISVATLSSSQMTTRLLSSAKGSLSSRLTAAFGSNSVRRQPLHTSRPRTAIRSPLPDIEVPEIPIVDFVFRDLKQFGDKPALVNGLTGQSLTFSQARDAVWRVASGLARHGVRQNDVVMIISENSVDYVITFHAVLSLGATMTLVNPIYPSNDVISQALDSGCKFLVTSQTSASKAHDVKNALQQQIKKVFVHGDETGFVPFSSLLADDGSYHPSEVKFDPRTQVALLPYSSGTTGMPKGVMLSHYNMVANTMQIDSPAYFQYRNEAVQLSVLPFYHIFAVNGAFMMALNWGQTNVILPRFDPRSFLELVPKHQISKVFLVPPIVLFLNKHPMAAKADLSSLRRVTSGAAPLSPEMVEEFHAKHPNCYIGQAYGLTETSPAIALNPLKSCASKPAASGVPPANTELKIVNVETGKECVGEEHGEICVKGPQVMLGYLNQPEATADMIKPDGWMHTGDIGYLDRDDHLFISDRLKELIKYKGLQVPPAELEAILCNHPAVVDAGVIGIPDDEAGELPRAYVALKQGVTASVEELQQFVSDKVVAYKRLRGGVEFVAEVPRSAAGKILRRQLLEKAKSTAVASKK